MSIVQNLQLLIFLVLGIALFVVELWALIDCLRRPAPSYVMAGKRTKGFWAALTGVAAAVGFVALPPPLGIGLFGGFLQFVAVVPAAVYLADVRPAVRGYGGGPRFRKPGGGW